MLTSGQIRAARALLRWEQSQLARAALLSVETIKRLERLDGPLLGATVATIMKIRRALEAAGVVFIDANGNGPGVRLRDREGRP